MSMSIVTIWLVVLFVVYKNYVTSARKDVLYIGNTLVTIGEMYAVPFLFNTGCVVVHTTKKGNTLNTTYSIPA